MIIYATKQTMERYRLKLPDEMQDPVAAAIAKQTIAREQGDRLLEWGAKLFYFEGRKCLLLSNFEAKLTFVLPDFKVGDLEYLGDVMADYMLELYQDNATMTQLLKRLFQKHPVVAFAKLTDKSAISSLNRMLSDDLMDGEILYDYIRYDPIKDKYILHSRELSFKISREAPVSAKINGKRKFFFPADRFEVLLCKRYNVPRREQLQRLDENGCL